MRDIQTMFLIGAPEQTEESGRARGIAQNTQSAEPGCIAAVISDQNHHSSFPRGSLQSEYR